jgi:hypothetical protein
MRLMRWPGGKGKVMGLFPGREVRDAGGWMQHIAARRCGELGCWVRVGSSVQMRTRIWRRSVVRVLRRTGLSVFCTFACESVSEMKKRCVLE